MGPGVCLGLLQTFDGFDVTFFLIQGVQYNRKYKIVSI